MRKLFPVIALCLLPWMLTAQYILPKEVYSPKQRFMIDSLERNQNYFIRKSKAKYRIGKKEDGGLFFTSQHTVYTDVGFILSDRLLSEYTHNVLSHESFTYDEDHYVVKSTYTHYAYNGVEDGEWVQSYFYETLTSGLKVLVKIEEYFTLDRETKEWLYKDYKYNSKGWLISVRDSGRFNERGNARGIQVNVLKEYTYDDKGVLIKCTEKKNGERTKNQETYTYDSKGRLVISTSGNKWEPDSTKFLYNTIGVLEGKRIFNKYSSDSTRQVIQYSEFNGAAQFAKSVTTSTYYNPSAKVTWRTVREYKYDENGLLIKEVKVAQNETDGNQSTETWKYYYGFE